MKLIPALELTFPCSLTAVGGGGKTSLLFALAREAAGQNRSVLITTTTAMFNPEILVPEAESRHDRLVLGPPEALLSAPPGPGEIMVAAPELAAGGQKLKGFPPETIAPLLSPPIADLILIEGDGARMKPVKAPADHEPVIPPQTRLVAGCIGLDCLDRPLDSHHVHRPELLAAIAGQPLASPVSVRTLARLIGHGQGLFKGTPADAKRLLVLNKADTPELIRAARNVIETIPPGRLPDLVLVTCLASENDPVRFIKI